MSGMTKAITIADDVYDALVSLKEPGESLSDVARRLADEVRRRRMEGLRHRRGAPQARDPGRPVRDQATTRPRMILLDSDVIIDYLKGEGPAHAHILRLASEGAPLGTTSLNVAEVLRGAYARGSKDDIRTTEHVLAGLREIPFGPRAARRCARLLATLDRTGQSTSLADAVVTSIALEEGIPIMTRNAADFARFEGLAVHTPGH